MHFTLLFALLFSLAASPLCVAWAQDAPSRAPSRVAVVVTPEAPRQDVIRALQVEFDTLGVRIEFREEPVIPQGGMTVLVIRQPAALYPVEVHAIREGQAPLVVRLEDPLDEQDARALAASAATLYEESLVPPVQEERPAERAATTESREPLRVQVSVPEEAGELEVLEAGSAAGAQGGEEVIEDEPQTAPSFFLSLRPEVGSLRIDGEPGLFVGLSATLSFAGFSPLGSSQLTLLHDFRTGDWLGMLAPVSASIGFALGEWFGLDEDALSFGVQVSPVLGVGSIGTALGFRVQPELSVAFGDVSLGLSWLMEEAWFLSGESSRWSRNGGAVSVQVAFD